MKPLRSLIPFRLLVPIGLVLVATPSIIGHFTAVTDFVRGAFMGMGISLEIAGVILLRRNRVSACESSIQENE